MSALDFFGLGPIPDPLPCRESLRRDERNRKHPDFTATAGYAFG
jgi:hypothetical protein